MVLSLKIKNLSKTYPNKVKALVNLNLELGKGIYGLLGPNGAGKTTLMNILATVIRPSSGEVLYNGKNILQSPNRLRRSLGYLPQYFGIYPNLNSYEFLSYLAALKGITGKTASKRIAYLLELVNLTDVAKRPLKSYSGGLKQRVGIAQALLNDPELLIVDEPTAGLDPEERVRFRNLLTELSLDKIVILSTHIVSDVESTATQIIIIKKGQLLTISLPEDLLQKMEGKVWRKVIPSPNLLQYQKQYTISGMVRRQDGLHIRILSDSSPDGSSKTVTPTLEDAYIYHIADKKEDRPSHP